MKFLIIFSIVSCVICFFAGREQGYIDGRLYEFEKRIRK